MSKERDIERVERDHQRSEEAHWQVAEAGAEDEEPVPDAARQSDQEEDAWENEGGGLETEPKRTPH